jgi:hypothetical protein
MLLRSASAAAHSLASKPRLAVVPFFDEVEDFRDLAKLTVLLSWRYASR